MPAPPPAGEEFVVSIAFPGPVASAKEQQDFADFKKKCNDLAAQHGGRVTEAKLQPKPKPPTP